MINSNKKLTYIYNKKDLQDVINFLEAGYKWSKKRSNEIKKHFSKQITSVPMGAYRKEYGKIKIAILLFNQSNYFKNKKKIISLCSMYADTAYRGIPAINFAKSLTQDLDNYTITNYSPNYVAYKIWKSVGWKEMKVKKIQLGFIKKFPFFKLSQQKNLFDLNIFKKAKFIYINKNNTENQKNSFLIFYILRQLRIKNKFLNTKILDIYINKKDKIGIPIWSVIMHMLKNKCLQLNIFINNSDHFKRSGWDDKKLNWLIKNSKNNNNYIIPLGSEKCIKTGIERK